MGRRNRKRSKIDDRLNSLNDDLLIRIISYLPAKDLIGTSILSRRWRNLWRSATGLFFTDHLFSKKTVCCFSKNNHRQSFTDFVDYVLAHSNPQIVDSLKLDVTYIPFHKKKKIQQWVNFATTTPNLNFLQIHAKRVGEGVLLPVSIFNFHLLICLDIAIKSHNCIISWPTSACLPSLKRLTLTGVHFQTTTTTITTRDSISRSCCRLQSWKMENCSGLAQLTVSCPDLKEFIIKSCKGLHDLLISTPRLEVCKVEGCFMTLSRMATSSFGIQAPNLRTFHWAERPFNAAAKPFFSDTVVQLKSLGGSSEFLLSLPETREMRIDSISIVNCLMQDWRLDFDRWLFQNVQVLDLFLDFNVLKSISTICDALRFFPNLRSLVITTDNTRMAMGPSSVCSAHDRCNEVELRKLVQVNFREFQGTTCQMEFIKFILAVSSSLERITIKKTTSRRHVFSDFSVVADELAKLPFASPNLRFFILEN